MQTDLLRFADPVTRPLPRNNVKNLGCRDCARYHGLTCPRGTFWLIGMNGEKKCIFKQKTVPANR